MAFRVSCPGTRPVYTIERVSVFEKIDARERDPRPHGADAAGRLGRRASSMLAAGSRYETPESKGIAHFSEHMFFKGTERRPTARTISTEIDAIGGEFNAFTGKELTGYYVRCGSETRDVALDVLTDMLLDSRFDARGDREGEGRDPRGDERLPRHAAALRRQRLRPAAVRRPAARLGHPRHARDDRGRDARDVHVVPRHLVPARADRGRDRRTASATASRERLEELLGGIEPRETGSAPRRSSSRRTDRPSMLHTKQSEQAHLDPRRARLPDRAPEPLRAPAPLRRARRRHVVAALHRGARAARPRVLRARGAAPSYTDTGTLYAGAGVDVSRIDEAITTILGELRKIAAEPVPADELEKARGYREGPLRAPAREPAGNDPVRAPARGARGRDRGAGRACCAQLDAVTVEDVQRVARDLFEGKRLYLARRRAVRRPGALREAARGLGRRLAGVDSAA